MKLRFATSNHGKFREATELLARYGIELEMEPVKGIEIQSGDLERIAVVSALTSGAREPFFVEDAGLFIDHLGGFPGPYSSYALSTIGCEGILRLMEGVTDRRARFVSVVVLVDGGIRVFRGVAEGRIATEMRGEGGFGFDPIFIPEGVDRTFAEMGVGEKNEFSHRARALREMARHLGVALGGD
ncbi:MAG: non-canonical purine NTP pyrophosphatase, RdgB/HAM1 family [Thermoplasmata archaeon]|nr:MAG: non-canonical purine NTP pyrophosphatase, RdgB/HAM1 family [Thermoplasmata archaeon]